MTEEEILKLSDEELNAKVEELLGNEVVKGYVFETMRVPCPDDKPGCLVEHFGLIPRPVRAFTRDIAAAMELFEASPRLQAIVCLKKLSKEATRALCDPTSEIWGCGLLNWSKEMSTPCFDVIGADTVERAITWAFVFDMTQEEE